MNWLAENWYIIVALLSLAILVIAFCVWFFKLPNAKKIENVKKWLEYAVAQAEKELGGGTGQLKLRKVWDMAITKFPWISTFVTFETFSTWVDDALVWLENQLSNNPQVNEIIKGQ